MSCSHVYIIFFFSSRRRHTRCSRDWSSDVCSSDLAVAVSGVLSKAPAKEFVLGVVAAKMAAPAMELFFRGVLCNALVCLAVWMGLRTKDETARLVLIFWCLFAFIGAGFEHSVANMTLLALGLFLPHDPDLVAWTGFGRNLGIGTLGNI